MAADQTLRPISSRKLKKQKKFLFFFLEKNTCLYFRMTTDQGLTVDFQPHAKKQKEKEKEFTLKRFLIFF